MSVVTYEAVVEHGQIKLLVSVNLPENPHVFVVVPNLASESTPHIYSPRLKNPADAKDFVMQVSEDSNSADV